MTTPDNYPLGPLQIPEWLAGLSPLAEQLGFVDSVEGMTGGVSLAMYHQELIRLMRSSDDDGAIYTMLGDYGSAAEDLLDQKYPEENKGTAFERERAQIAVDVQRALICLEGGRNDIALELLEQAFGHIYHFMPGTPEQKALAFAVQNLTVEVYESLIQWLDEAKQQAWQTITELYPTVGSFTDELFKKGLVIQRVSEELQIDSSFADYIVNLYQRYLQSIFWLRDGS